MAVAQTHLGVIRCSVFARRNGVTGHAPPVQTAKRLKYVVSLRRSRVDDTDDGRPYIGLEQIEAGTGRLIQSSAEVEGELEEPAAVAGESLSNTLTRGS